MPWNEADRQKYEVIRSRDSSDMLHAEFELIVALLPLATDFEATAESSLARLHIALAFLPMRRL